MEFSNFENNAIDTIASHLGLPSNLLRDRFEQNKQLEKAFKMECKAMHEQYKKLYHVIHEDLLKASKE